jgi:hypothetical protein
MLSMHPSTSAIGRLPREHALARNDDVFDPDELLLGRLAGRVEETAEEIEDAADARLFEWDALASDIFREADRYLD